MHFISYYYDKNPSESTYYSTCAANLAKQLSSYGYEYSFDYINFDKEGLDSSYLKLNMIKPSFILKKIKELNTGVIWIDADCSIVKPITEFKNLPNDFDLAYGIREHDNINPHAAVLYFNKTENSIKFLQEWETLNNIKVKDPNYDCSEHCTLIDLLRENPESSIRKTNIPLNIKSFKDIIRADYLGNAKLKQYYNSVKIWIGISPAAFEYTKQQEQNRKQI